MSYRWRSVLLALALMFVALGFAPTAVAGPNADGVLLVHANPPLVYTTDTADYCGQSDLAACSLAVTTVPWAPDTTRVFFILAAFPESSQPRLKAISFGDIVPGQQHGPKIFARLEQVIQVSLGIVAAGRA
jgi:hypothetical protein